MNKNKLKGLAAYLLVALIVTACNQEEHIADTTRVAARFSVGMDGGSQEVTTQSRASGDTWNREDSIGVFMVNNGTSDLFADAENVKYWSEGGTSTFTVAQGYEDIYFPVDETQKVDFWAYYPFSSEVNNLIYPVSVSNQDNQAAIDLLYANSYRFNTAGYDKTDPEVNLVFSHQLARLVLETIPGQGMTSLSGMAVRVHGMNTNAEFDLSTGKLSTYDNPGNLPIDIKMIEDGKRYEAIFLPAVTTYTGEWRFDFILGTDIYTWYVPSNVRFEAGVQHGWSISVQRVPIPVSARIEPWVVAPTNTGIAN